MELQFETTARRCLQALTSQVQDLELTQEVRLADALPDIGRVLGVWAQPLMRSKEWRKDSMYVTGGVMAWALYCPQEGEGVHWVEAWLPFQLKWDLPETEHDGIMRALPLVCSADGRSASARKLLVRVELSVLAQASVDEQIQLAQPGELPEDVQLLTRKYPVLLPVEAGEKLFTLEDDLQMGPGKEPAEQLIAYFLQPEVIDRKVMTDKVVFRGRALAQLLYRTRQGQLESCQFEVPFSQYTDLDREYPEAARVELLMAPTGLEMELEEDGRIHIKAGLTGQYVVYDAPVLELVEDAYSPVRRVTCCADRVQLPAVLDMTESAIQPVQHWDEDGAVVLAAFCHGHPQVQRRGDGVQLCQRGQFQLLHRDGAGQYHGHTCRWEDGIALAGDGDVQFQATAVPTGTVSVTREGAGQKLQTKLLLQTVATARKGLPMVSALELGEVQPKPEDRPSVILCRAGERSLWEMAKQYGSTVDAISGANGLHAEPNPGQMLLIPIP